MIWSKEKPKDSTQRLSELINKYNKVAGYKISIQKSVPFVYIYKNFIEEESNLINNSLTEKNKILGINLTKKSKDRYKEKFQNTD
jgi:hypothetical protein